MWCTMWWVALATVLTTVSSTNTANWPKPDQQQLTTDSGHRNRFDVVATCQQNCPQQLNLENDMDIACNSTCKIKQCQIGCQFWNEHPSSCFDVCQDSSDIENWVIYCAIGCNHAHTVYVEHVRSKVGVPPAPVLVPNTITNDSLSIEWATGDEHLSRHNITYRVQWRYQNLSSTWTYATEQATDENRLRLSGLFAYTSYLFRVEWVIVPWQRISIFSRSSQSITTQPYGVPSTPSVITNCLAISGTQVSVSWQQPHFANGPVIAYTLYLTDNTTGHRVVKDLQMHSQHYQLVNNGPMNYVFNGLKPNTDYTVTIITFNNFGEGPHCQRHISTSDGSISSEKNSTFIENYPNEHYKLYLASNKEVGRRSPELLLDEEIIYHLTDYTENAEITGMAIHVMYKYLFVSDSSGAIRRILLKENSINEVLRIINGSNNPSHLSIDWLNDKLYFIEESRITRCNLNGDWAESVVTGFRQRPIDMKVDPYNGYLYWLLNDVHNNTGLYRVDLADIGTSVDGSKVSQRSIQLIYQSQRITTFAVNYFNYRIYFPEASSKSIFSITIDGKDAMNIRDNSNSADVFVDIENMVIYNRKLYLTKGNNISWEEYHEEEGLYYHSIYSTESKLVSLLVMDYQSQPYPMPLNPVEKVQAVFLDTSAKISWEKPGLFGGSGRGAWQDWKYEVSIQESGTEVVHLAQVNNITNCDAVELSPDTEYQIKVRALSISGKGAWSDIFIGRTLPSLSQWRRRPFAVASTKDGLLKTDIDGKFRDQLLTRSKINGYISDIAWYRDVILINTDNTVLSYNSTSQFNLTRIANITNAASIAVEWLAPKLYWSNPFERMICRSNLDGSQLEILPIMAYANKIAIDSANGLIYWSTLYNIQYSFLNGMKRSQQELFRAQEIKSISIDSVSQSLYWVAVVAGQSPTLYRADLLQTVNGVHLNGLKHQPAKVETVSTLLDFALVGPVSIFAQRMFWLNTDTNQVLISDAQAKTFATLKDIKNIYAFQVVDWHSAAHNKSIKVVPEPVKHKHIRIEGTWQNFTLTWQPVTNVNYGQVFYDLMLEHGQNRTNIVLNDTRFHYPPNNLAQLKPYSKIKVAIRAFTYWASAKQVVRILHTPSSIPSKPGNVRVFTHVSQNPLAFISLMASKSSSRNSNITAEARWSPPKDPNGLIMSYTVSLWTVPHDNRVTSLTNKVIPNQLSYQFDNLQANTTYYFEVRATTDVGEGPPSDVYQFKTFTDAPPSRLLLAESDAILLADMDLGQNARISKSLSPLMLDYIFAENILYWIEEGNFLKRASFINGTNFTLMAHLHEKATGLAVDWIGRRVYISTVDRHKNKSTIWLLDHSNEQAQVEELIHFMGKEILTLRISPFTSELVWTEVLIHGSSTFGHATLRVCQLESYGRRCKSVRDLFPRDRKHLKSKSCNCTYSTTVGPSFAMDFSRLSASDASSQHSNSERVALVLYYDEQGKYFASTDLGGCFCRRISPRLQTTSPESVTFDTDLYWINDTSKAIIYRCQAPKDHTETLNSETKTPIERFDLGTNSIRNLASFNVRHQPYPDFSCLIPHSLHTVVELVDNSAFSLVLRVRVERDDSRSECGEVSLASLRYRIRYRKHDNVQIDCRLDGVQQCRSFYTHNDTFTVTDLEPYTNYTFSVELDNFYLEMSRNVARSQLRAASGNTSGQLSNNDINGGDVMFVPSEAYQYLLSDNLIFSTAESRPGPPQNVRAIVETPEKIRILWDEPEKLNSNQISYEVRWYSVESSRKSLLHSNNQTQLGSYYMYLENVKPGKEYNVSVRAYAVDNHQFMDSEPILVRSFDEPNPLKIVKMYARYAVLRWVAPSTLVDNKSVIESHQLWRQPEEQNNHDNWTLVFRGKTRPNSIYEFIAKHLKPNTRYRFKLLLTYRPTKEQFLWPRKVLAAKTLNDVPDTPKLNEVIAIDAKGDKQEGALIYKISWNSVNSNSEWPVYYSLYERLQEDSQPEEEDNEHHQESNAIERAPNVSGKGYVSYSLESNSKWNMVYNGTETYWILSGLESGKKHLFRLAANNPMGNSSFSESATAFYLPFQDSFELSPQNENVLILVFSMCAVFAILLIIISLCSLRLYQFKEKSLDNSSLNCPMELVPWQELPSHPHTQNALYINSNIENVDLGEIDVIDYKNITLLKFLGSGAFGKVYEGILHKSETRVAVKVLGKGAREDEQANFLKEAKFMAKFKHPHILQLLGVCLNSDQFIIVLELMEGGDLLKYLRSNRPNGLAPSALTMDDLLGICIDIAKGCEYLQNIHFVHRDLAARNCLVSSLDRSQRVVKIADFGLTRGLYKQNYYRKEGGLLPVRWMAPESLVDGVFTTQSDVWSFGIIMYEVMTLGQQPYQALSNSQVLEYVRHGGILDKPDGCPYELYSLMKMCWNFDKEARPQFSEILRDLEAIRLTYQCQDVVSRKTNSVLTTVHNQNYVSMTSQLAMIANPAFAYNNVHEPSQPTDRSSLSPSRLTSATLVLEPSPPISQVSLGAATNALTSTYLNCNGRPTPICEGSNSLVTLAATSDINDNFVDLDGYQIPIKS